MYTGNFKTITIKHKCYDKNTCILYGCSECTSIVVIISNQSHWTTCTVQLTWFAISNLTHTSVISFIYFADTKSRSCSNVSTYLLCSYDVLNSVIWSTKSPSMPRSSSSFSSMSYRFYTKQTHAPCTSRITALWWQMWNVKTDSISTKQLFNNTEKIYHKSDKLYHENYFYLGAQS